MLILLILPELCLAEKPPVILVIGDSLSAAYGMEKHKGWVNLLQKRLQAENRQYHVINASITGDTTRGGRSRLPQILERETPAIVVIELGGNDGLRGFALSGTRDNLTSMIEASKKANAKVLLLGVRIPANYGEKYRSQFESIFTDLAGQFDISAIPYFLQGISDNMQLMQDDGIHPSAEAQPMMLENVWPTLMPLL